MRLAIKVLATDLDLEKDIEEIEKEFAEAIPVEARRIVDESTPAGKIYRRGGITGRRTAAGIKSGLMARRKNRMVIGSKFHRASAPGQPWAKDSGRAYRDIKVMRTGRGKYRVVFGAPHIGYLEFNLNRPVILPAVEAAARKIFNQ